MKKNIFIYLFSFVGLILIFQIVNSNKIMLDQQRRLENKQERINDLKASLKEEKRSFFESTYFSLETNSNSIKELDLSKLNIDSKTIKEALLETNKSGTNQNLIPYSKKGVKFLINKTHVINQKWLIADFSDGTNWGELFIEYSVNDKNEISFKLLDDFMYSFE